MSYKSNICTFNGFSLAEILLTLVVIGVIACETIPVLIKSYEGKEFEVRVKKVGTIVNQILKLKQADDGDFSFFNAGNDHNDFRDAFTPYMRFVKTGGTTSLFPSFYAYYKNYSGGGWTMLNYAGGITYDGIYYGFLNNSSGCTTTSGTLQNICGYFFTDTNGLKGPNMYGKDFNFFWVVKKSGTYVVYPRGITGDSMTCVAGSVAQNTSRGCTAYYFRGQTLP